MTMWKICMILMLPLMLEHRRLRVWLAMMTGSMAAWVLPPLTASLDGLGLYILIDLAVGFVILRHPRGIAQMLLGSFSVMMVTFSCGALFAKMLHGTTDPDFYWRSMMLFSWARLLILASWGMADVARRYMFDNRSRRHSLVIRGNI